MDAEKFSRIYHRTRNGCNDFIRHPLGRSFAYSDGVQDLAETGCYWLLDILATELPIEFKRNKEVSPFCTLTVISAKRKAKLTASFTKGVVAWSKDIGYTDMPDGEWIFFINDDGGPTPYRMILPNEY